ncbi:MAG: hypothetical protein J0M02_12730 [Planctomycetes bacterium]|nr:hypothetical protein [Planctomycetota bacterium]
MRPAILLAAAALAAAADDADPWIFSGKLGAFLQNVASHNAEVSRDPAIAASSDSLAWTASGEARLIWLGYPGRFEQRLEADYGRIRYENASGWIENTDDISYEATYEGFLHAPHFLYAGGTVDTVFTGPEPDREFADPLLAKLSSGYGQRYEDLLPESDALVWRLGLYARKRWEDGAPRYQTDIDAGPEALIRYERRQSRDVTYHAQWETYGEVDDPRHVTCVGQAGLSVRVARRMAVELKLRCYYESRPREAAATDPGYGVWSLREDAQVGLVWETGGS